MKKGNYEYCKELARQILSDHGATEFPVDVWKICDDYGIVVSAYRSEKKSPGCCFVYEGLPMIFIDDRQTEAKRRFVCAHELGHILMGHVGAWGYIADFRDLPKHIKERAAMVFAVELLYASSQTSCVNG